MSDASEVFESYLRGILCLAGADSATLFVPPSVGGSVDASLVHVGASAPLPEFCGVATALEFVEAAVPQLHHDNVTAVPPLPAVASADPKGRVLPVPPPSSLSAVRGRGREASGRRRSDREDQPPIAWLGLRLSPGSTGWAGADELRRLLLDGEGGDQACSLGSWLVALGSAIAAYHLRISGFVGDSVAGLPGRAELQRFLTEEIAVARAKGGELALFFINPDDFGKVNEYFGREAGDRVMREIAERLAKMRRRGDLVARFGGAIFASVLANASPEDAGELAERCRVELTREPYLDGAVRLGFSVGVACFPAEDEAPDTLELVRRADQALNAAKRAGGGVVTIWAAGSGIEQVENLDRLTGVFTGNMAKDYRNMVLLWEVLGVIASNAQLEALVDQVLEPVMATIKPRRLVLFTTTIDGGLEARRSVERPLGERRGTASTERVELGSDGDRLIERAQAAGSAILETVDGDGDSERLSVCVVPLLLEEERFGYLYLEGEEDDMVLDSSDLIFLQALATQLAVALDRVRLTEQERGRQDEERRRLRAELNELRSALQQARLVYSSIQMEQLLATARRVAATDATILITGESGTGKDLLAHTIHELSDRREGPMVVVDCGSIPPTLIESELFGHERGAYTGAQRRARGRLEQAQGGTVLLDEISELPLEVQSRLLRFVQEKELTRVGGSRSQQIDVRIVAATNRNLEQEVAAGRFREDLFYRLNVVRLLVPPLRERPDDVIHLARHYLESYALTYQKTVGRLTVDAERLLLDHDWPGNVRELQNRMMQAVILCDGDELGVDDLESLAALVEGRETRTPAQSAVEPPPLADAAEAAGHASPEPASPWEQLRSQLACHVEAALSDNGAAARPLGKWLAEDLILEAHAAAAGVTRRAAARVGIPETTFSRRWRQAEARAAAGLSQRPESWRQVRAAVARLLGGDETAPDGNLLKRGELLLLEEILARRPADVRFGSSLLGVTPPTYRRRVAELGR